MSGETFRLRCELIVRTLLACNNYYLRRLEPSVGILVIGGREHMLRFVNAGGVSVTA